MKIYTKTGDGGMTGLFAGPRVEKDHPRIEAYGAVDELSAVLGVTIAGLEAELKQSASGRAAGSALADLTALLISVQSDLFAIGAELATPDPVKHQMCLLKSERVTELENWIDRLDTQLPPLENFVLPGGCSGSAWLHLARTVCRRVERSVVHFARDSDGSDCSLIVIYLNRLSDFLFVAARYVNLAWGVQETVWQRP